jgi:putative ABC transport system permease protein
VGLVVVLILFVIIMVGITNTFRMIIYERTREIGTMRALGLQRGSVRGLFLLEALFLSLGGVALGLAGAFVVGLVLTLINFGMDNQFFVILREGHLSFKVLVPQLIGNVAIVAGLTLVAALVPAGRAAKLDPAHALRKTY